MNDETIAYDDPRIPLGPRCEPRARTTRLHFGALGEPVPKLNRELIRGWLEDHNWTIARLTAECNAMGEDTFSEGTVRNAVNGIDPMRPGRIKVICRVLAKYGDGIPYAHLADDAQTSSEQRG
jgi:hypothetical protein